MTSDNKEFAKNEVLADAAERAKAGNGRLHYLGLVSYQLRWENPFLYRIVLCLCCRLK